MSGLERLDLSRLAERVRVACLNAAAQVYEDAGLQGLCADGRWECARRAIHALDLDAVLRRDDRTSGTPHSDGNAE